MNIFEILFLKKNLVFDSKAMVKATPQKPDFETLLQKFTAQKDSKSPKVPLDIFKTNAGKKSTLKESFSKKELFLKSSPQFGQEIENKNQNATKSLSDQVSKRFPSDQKEHHSHHMAKEIGKKFRSGQKQESDKKQLVLKSEIFPKRKSHFDQKSVSDEKSLETSHKEILSKDLYIKNESKTKFIFGQKIENKNQNATKISSKKFEDAHIDQKPSKPRFSKQKVHEIPQNQPIEKIVKKKVEISNEENFGPKKHHSNYMAKEIGENIDRNKFQKDDKQTNMQKEIFPKPKTNFGQKRVSYEKNIESSHKKIVSKNLYEKNEPKNRSTFGKNRGLRKKSLQTSQEMRKNLSSEIELLQAKPNFGQNIKLGKSSHHKYNLSKTEYKKPGSIGIDKKSTKEIFQKTINTDKTEESDLFYGSIESAQSNIIHQANEVDRKKATIVKTDKKTIQTPHIASQTSHTNQIKKESKTLDISKRISPDPKAETYASTLHGFLANKNRNLSLDIKKLNKEPAKSLSLKETKIDHAMDEENLQIEQITQKISQEITKEHKEPVMQTQAIPKSVDQISPQNSSQNDSGSQTFDQSPHQDQSPEHPYSLDQNQQQMPEFHKRVITIRLDQTNININFASSQLNITFSTMSRFHHDSSLSEFVDEVLKESGYEKYKVTLKDRQKRVELLSKESKTASATRSGIDVKA